MDETYAYFKGSFGEFRIGDEDDARKLKAVVAPSATGVYGATSPLISFSNNPIGTNSLVGPGPENDSTKIIYFTPNFGGFQLAVSYAPDASQDVRGSSNNPLTGNAGNSYSWAVGGSYEAKFGNVGLLISGGYSNANPETVTGGVQPDDPESLHIGTNITFGPFTIGGGYAHHENFAVAGAGMGFEQTLFDLGAVYAMGPWRFGVSWSHGDYEGVGGDPELDFFVVDTRYNIGPGIFLDAAVHFVSYDANGTTSSSAIPDINTGAASGTRPFVDEDYDSVTVIVGARINF